MLIRLITLVCASATLPQLVFAEDTSWPQFGGAFNWQVNARLSTDRLGIAWTAVVGAGRGQIVGSEEAIFVVSGEVTQETPPQIITTVTCREPATGALLWQHTDRTSTIEEQQTFSGDPPSPQATPAVLNGRLYVVSFAGQLQCLSCRDGRLLWEQHLVDDLHADPVQFGFASSPVIAPGNDSQIFVLAAGEQGGFHALDAATGQIVWTAACRSFSYATPVFAVLHGQPQWIVVSQKAVKSVHAGSSSRAAGSELWRYDWSEAGLTNVPTPLVMNDSTVVISGQGSGGTRGLTITHDGREWHAAETWALKSPQYFYTNWMKLSEGLMVGADARTLTAIDTRTGERVGRWRGFADANLIRVGDQLICVDGRGKMTRLQIACETDGSISGLQPLHKATVMEGRCWTAASYIGHQLYVRAEDRLVCLNAASQNLPSLLTSDGKQLSLQRRAVAVADPVEQIFTAFEEQGAAAALTVYSRLRAAEQLDAAARCELVQAAQQQGLAEIARRIARDAALDYPDQARAPWIQEAIKQK